MIINYKTLRERIFQNETTLTKTLVWIYCTFFIFIIFAGWWYYSDYKSKLKAEMAEQLTAVGKLKAEELSQWRKERLGDGKFFFRNTIFSSIVSNYFNNPDSQVFKTEIEAWLKSVQTAYEYDKILLLDDKFQTRMSIPEDANNDSFSMLISRKRQIQQVEIEDFYYDENKQKSFLSIVVPVFQKNSNNLIGALVLSIDPAKYLYLNIQEWPVPSINTAETILVRLNNDSVKYLNELRFYPDKAVILKRSAKDVNIPAVRAALGHEGVMEGVDYRGVEVLAYGQQIYNSPWYIITKIDESEIYQSLYKKILIITVFIVVLMVGTGAAIGYIWEQRAVNIYRHKYYDAKEWNTTFDSVVDPISIIDKDCRFKLVNKKFADLIGKKPEDIVGMSCFKLIYNSNSRPCNCPLKETLTDGKPMQIELNLFGANWEVSTYPIFNDDGKVVEAVHFMRDVTEKQKTEAVLRESESRFRGMFEHSVAGIVIVAEDLHFVNVNKAFCQMLGYSKEKLLTMTVKDITFAEDWESSREEIEKLCKGDVESFSMEKRYYHSSGTIVWGVACAALIKDANGNLLQLAQVYDITERKKTEKELLLKTGLLESQLDSTIDGVLVVDENNRRLLTNKRLIEMWKVPEHITNDIEDEPFLEFAVSRAKDPEKFFEKVKYLYTHQDQTSMDEIEFKDGLIMDRYSSPVVDKSGHYLGRIWLFRDITERKKAEQEIIRQRDLAQCYLDTVETMIVVLDKVGNITTLNRKSCHVLGRNENELIGKSWFSSCLPQPQGIESVYPVFLKLMSGQTESVEYYENPIISSTGEIREIAWHNAVLKDKQGQIVGILSAGLDITQEKKAQQQILIERNNLKAIFESSPVGMLLIDENIKIIEANAVMAGMVHKKPFELAGQNGCGVLGCINVLESGKDCGFTPACPECPLRSSIIQVLQTGTSICCSEIELTLHINNQPQNLWLSISIETVILNGHKHVIVAFNDITNRKRIEQILREANERLKIANDMAKDAAVTAAIAEEHQRQRIAMLLHDKIGQDMVLAVMKLDAIDKAIKTGCHTDIEIKDIKTTMEKTIEAVRTLSFDLSSPILYKFGFATAVDSWMKELSQENKNTKFNFVNNTNTAKLDKDTNIILYQVIHELLLNIVKHAEAKNADVRLKQTDETIEITIKDDGKGFEVSKIGQFDPKKGGFGLGNIRDRITYLGGSFKIESKPGNGTQIAISIPAKITN